MTTRKHLNATGETAITVVSPMAFGGEVKNQDRARWSNATRTAAVADGVTSSPHSVQAAQIVIDLSPMLFLAPDVVESRLGVLADLLRIKRLEAQVAGLKAGSSTPAAIRSMLQDAANEKLQHSHQTTLVSANFVAAGDAIVSTVINIGDSAFFAFGPDNQLLYTSLPLSSSEPTCDNTAAGLSFGPGACLLAKIRGDASEFPALAHAVGIRPCSAGNWFVVTPIDLLAGTNGNGQARPIGSSFCSIRLDEPIVVPRYLVDPMEDAACSSLCKIRFSRNIRIPGESRCFEQSFDGKGAATAVLPDHFPGRAGHCVTERFPRATDFLLCSDGFYSAFDNTTAMRRWLLDHKDRLRDSTQHVNILETLHQQLHDKCGDDDISFVWVFGDRLTRPADGETDHVV